MSDKGTGLDQPLNKVMDKFVEHHLGPDHEPRPCPRDVADIILQILQTGVVYARAAGWWSDAELAAIEADHIHNLPDLLRRYTYHKIKHYWNCERPFYITKYARHVGKEPTLFAKHWQTLEPLVPQE